MSLDPDVVFGSDSINTPMYKISEHACSDYPNCEWGDDCGGQHSYSSTRSDDTVEGHFCLANDDFVEGVPSESPVMADIGLLDSSLVVDGVVPECLVVVDRGVPNSPKSHVVVDRGVPNSPESPVVAITFVVDSCDDDVDGLVALDWQSR